MVTKWLQIVTKNYKELVAPNAGRLPRLRVQAAGRLINIHEVCINIPRYRIKKMSLSALCRDPP